MTAVQKHSAAVGYEGILYHSGFLALALI